MNDPITDLKTRLALSTAIDTPLEVLEQLVSDEVTDVRRAIALNPNASEELLRKLGKAFPEEIVQNPVFGILALENPGSAFIYLAKARSAATSPEALATLSQESTDLEILTAVCENSSTPTYVLQDLVDNPPDLYVGPDEYDDGDRHQPIFSAIAQNKNAPAALLRTIFEKHETAEYGLSRNPNTPVDILEKLSKRYGYSLQMALLENSALPAHIVGRFLIERDNRIHSAAQAHPNQPKNARELIGFINENPDTSPELLDQLSADYRRDVRHLVAKHPNTSPRTLGKLAKDTDSKIIYSVANHPNSDSKILEIAAAFFVHQYNVSSDSAKHWILKDAAKLGEHPQVTDGVLQILMKGISPVETDLGITLAAMETIPAKTLISIAKRANSALTMTSSDTRETFFARSRKSPSIYETLSRNLAAPSEALNYVLVWLTQKNRMHASNSIVRNLAKHPHLSELWFSEFLKMPELLGCVASNPNLTRRMVNQLIATRYQYALVGLARNPHTPPDVLLRLIRESENVRVHIDQNMKNRNYTSLIDMYLGKKTNHMQALIETLTRSARPAIRRVIAKRPSLPVEILEKLSKDYSAEVRACVAANPSLLVEILGKLSKDDSAEVRACVAANPSLPVEMLEKLSKDDSAQVCACVAANPSTTAEMLERLVEHPDCDVRAQMVNHPNISQRILLILAEEDSVKIRAGLARRPDLNELVIHALFRKTAVELPIEIEKYNQEGPKKGLLALGKYSPDGKHSDSRVCSAYNVLRTIAPHERRVMALITIHPHTPELLRDRIQADYGIKSR